MPKIDADAGLSLSKPEDLVLALAALASLTRPERHGTRSGWETVQAVTQAEQESFQRRNSLMGLSGKHGTLQAAHARKPPCFVMKSRLLA